MNKNTTNTTNTATANAVKPTTLCRVLLTNAKYTNRFIGKSNGEELYQVWINSLKAIKSTAFAYYKAEAENLTSEEVAKAEKEVYNALHNLLTFVGNVPTSDGKEFTKISAKVLFLDAIVFAVNHKAKAEITALQKAREALKNAKQDYRKTCFTEDGFVMRGLNEEFIKAKEEKIKSASAEVEKLLNKANASVFATSEVKIGTFAKHFEIALRKAIMQKYNFTAEEAKAEKEAIKAERKANRSKPNKVKKEVK